MMPNYGKLVDKELLAKLINEWEKNIHEATKIYIDFMNEHKPFNAKPKKFLGIKIKEYPQFSSYEDFINNYTFNLPDGIIWRIKDHHPKYMLAREYFRVQDFKLFLNESIVEVYFVEDDLRTLTSTLNLEEYKKLLEIEFLSTK